MTSSRAGIDSDLPLTGCGPGQELVELAFEKKQVDSLARKNVSASPMGSVPE